MPPARMSQKAASAHLCILHLNPARIISFFQKDTLRDAADPSRHVHRVNNTKQMRILRPLQCSLLTLLLAGSSLAQNTVGLLNYSADMAEGYVLVYPDLQGTVYMLNACGQIVHTWPDDASVPGNGSRLVNDGGLVRTYVSNSGGNPFFVAGGAGEFVQLKDWDNNVLWNYQVSSSTECIHHDVEVLPNGNVLLIAWELKTIQEAFNAGMDTTFFGYGSFWPDKVIEVQPSGPSGGTVVWEWHVWDHLVQDFNASAGNFGVVAEHPELVDINFSSMPLPNPDWLHTNSIDYNPSLDQIMLSVPFLNEIWVIDHSTTTAEAAGHTGGNSGKGGDLLYRWGNPAAYDHGGPEDQELFFNHAAVWIGPGLSPDDPDAGKIMVFNNRVQPGVSCVDIIVPPVDLNGNYNYQPGSAYAPDAHEQRFATNPPTDLSSPGQGSAQKLPTGNVLVSAGRMGWLQQLRPDSTSAWHYLLAMEAGVVVAQGVELKSPTSLFQAEWVNPDDQRIQGRELAPIGYIELEPNESFCVLTTAVDGNTDNHPAGLSLEATLATDVLFVHAESTMEYLILDPSGRVVASGILSKGRNELPLDRLTTGAYVLRSRSESQAGLRFNVIRH